MTELFHIEHIEREERIIFKCLRLHISFYTNPKRYYYDFCKNSTVLLLRQHLLLILTFLTVHSFFMII